LSAFSGDTFEILLGLCIGVAYLKKQTFLTDRLAMELLDNLLTDVTALETASC